MKRKTKLAVLLGGILFLACGLARAGSLGVYFQAGGGWNCAPRTFCRPAPCGFPVAAYYYAPVYSYWGPAVYYSGPSSGFSNVSPLMSYADAAPVYKVPEPVILPAQPVTVYPGHTFSWRR